MLITLNPYCYTPFAWPLDAIKSNSYWLVLTSFPFFFHNSAKVNIVAGLFWHYRIRTDYQNRQETEQIHVCPTLWSVGDSVALDRSWRLIPAQSERKETCLHQAQTGDTWQWPYVKRKWAISYCKWTDTYLALVYLIWVLKAFSYYKANSCIDTHIDKSAFSDS